MAKSKAGISKLATKKTALLINQKSRFTVNSKVCSEAESGGCQSIQKDCRMGVIPILIIAFQQ
jgi:hypothetical protein